MSYKCRSCFVPEYDSGIRVDDSDLAINWQLEHIGGLQNVIISQKNRALQTFKEFMEKYGGLK